MTTTATIIADLRAGYGVEDIAQRTGSCVTAIRAEVARLRSIGVIPGEIYPGRAELDKSAANVIL